MSDQEDPFDEQLKQTCKLTGARWAVWLRQVGDDWEPGPQYGLTRTRLALLTDSIRQPQVLAWLVGAFHSGRIRFRACGELYPGLDCQRIFIIPNEGQSAVILVGADDLNKEAQAFFKILAISNPFAQELLVFPSSSQSSLLAMVTHPESGYHLNQIYNWILEVLSKTVPAGASYLALLSGDVFHIQAQRQYSESIEEISIYVAGNPKLLTLRETREPFILSNWKQPPAFLFAERLTWQPKSCM